MRAEGVREGGSKLLTGGRTSLSCSALMMAAFASRSCRCFKLRSRCRRSKSDWLTFGGFFTGGCVKLRFGAVSLFREPPPCSPSRASASLRDFSLI